MKNLRPETLGMLQRIEALSGRPVEFKPDSSLTLRATLQLARNGAPSHVLRYRPTNEPLDYWVAYQAGYLLRLLELPPAERFDFAGTGTAPSQVAELLATGQPQADDARSTLTQFAEMTAHWAMLNLRSYAIGMRIDQWLADQHPELRELQSRRHGLAAAREPAAAVQAYRQAVDPGPADGPGGRIRAVCRPAAGQDGLCDTVPGRRAGPGAELLAILDKVPPGAAHDRELVDAWAAAIGMTGWYAWIPYKP
jgi:hypothetical protein